MILRKKVAISGLAAASALALASCAGGSAPTESAGNNAGNGASGTITYRSWTPVEATTDQIVSAFQQANPGVTVNYDPIGSGGGREQFISGGFSFAGSDSYLTDDEGELDAATKRCDGQAPIEVPSYVSPIAVVYNLDGVDDLRLSPDTLAGIFAGTITSWDDPAIVEDNPGADLPAERINAVHRSDEAGRASLQRHATGDRCVAVDDDVGEPCTDAAARDLAVKHGDAVRSEVRHQGVGFTALGFAGGPAGSSFVAT